MPRNDKPPIWTEEALNRLLGARDGYAGALMRVRQEMASYVFSRKRISARHCRKRADIDRIITPLRHLADHFQEQHASCQSAYVYQHARLRNRAQEEKR